MAALAGARVARQQSPIPRSAQPSSRPRRGLAIAKTGGEGWWTITPLLLIAGKQDKEGSLTLQETQIRSAATPPSRLNATNALPFPAQPRYAVRVKREWSVERWFGVICAIAAIGITLQACHAKRQRHAGGVNWTRLAKSIGSNECWQLRSNLSNAAPAVRAETERAIAQSQADTDRKLSILSQRYGWKKAGRDLLAP